MDLKGHNLLCRQLIKRTVKHDQSFSFREVKKSMMFLLSTR